MEKYTIYCTQEQTKRALELGASIYTTNEHLYNHPMCGRYWAKVEIQGNGYSARIPAAEQLIGWLEERGILVDVSAAFLHTNTPSYLYRIGFRFNDYVSNAIDYPSRKEATIAAIDAALDYLSKNK